MRSISLEIRRCRYDTVYGLIVRVVMTTRSLAMLAPSVILLPVLLTRSSSVKRFSSRVFVLRTVGSISQKGVFVNKKSAVVMLSIRIPRNTANSILLEFDDSNTVYI